MGRLLRGEHASTPQGWVEAPRLLKRSLPRLYYCCCWCWCCCWCCCWCFFQDGSSEEMSMSAKSCANWHGEPSMTKNSSSSRAPKTGAQLRDNLEEREKCEKSPKHPFIAAITAINGNPELNAVPVSVAQLEVLKRRDELNLSHLHVARHNVSA